MSIPQLKQRYTEAWNESPRSHNRVWLIKKIAWRLQANAEGGLPEMIRQQALKMANDADLRVRPKKSIVQDAAADTPGSATAELPDTDAQVIYSDRDPRLPPAGTPIVKRYKGQLISVIVRENDFEYEGNLYQSLSAIANQVTGSHVNGFRFFGLTKAGG